MKHIHLFAFACLLIALALVACQSSAPAQTAPSTVAQGAPTASSEGDLETKGFVESADGRLRVSGKSQLFVSLKMMRDAPAAPAGWEFVAPAFDVTAQDRQRRPIQKLAAALRLRFDVPANRAATVMVYNGAAWEIVPSEIDADGKLIADVEHLTPYVAAAPKSAQAAPKVTPRATVVAAPASSGDAQAALESAVAAIKGKKSKVTGAAGYTGSLAVPLPNYLQGVVNTVSASGVAYYGLYNAVNEAITAQAKSGSGSQGALTLLVEPKTAMPASATDARNALASSFAGIPVATMTQARADSTAYVFYATSGNTAYGAGYVSYNGLVLAYGTLGSGTWQSLVPKQ
ncbi:MAG: hypothetical protein AB1817_09880 [Chloroflexota bacterium]